MSEKCSKKVRKSLDTEWTIVLLRDGRLGIVMEDKCGDLSIFGCNSTRNALNLNGLVKVKEYDENFCCGQGDIYSNINRDYDIMAMCYNNMYLTPLGLKRVLFGLKDPSEIHWDWKREEVKEVTMADIEKAFGCKVKIVKEKENE